MKKLKYPIPFFGAILAVIGVYLYRFSDHSCSLFNDSYTWLCFIDGICSVATGICFLCIQWKQDAEFILSIVAVGFILWGTAQIVIALSGYAALLPIPDGIESVAVANVNMFYRR